MKKYFKITLLLVVTLVISSCEKEETEIDFEKRVMTEVFPSLVDSICVDSRKMIPPPMLGKHIYDKSGHYVRTDSTKATRKQKIEYNKWQREREEVEKDTSSIIIAFDPFLKKMHKKLIDESKVYIPNIEIYRTQKEENSKFRFDFEKIKLRNKFILKNTSEFPKVKFPHRITDLEYDFVFSGVFYLSRIEFDQQKKAGILGGSFDFCGRCGRGFIILIKKVNNKWVIDKIEQTSVS
jgi:hypothetical protein